MSSDEESKKTKTSAKSFDIRTYEPNKREQAILDECSRVFFSRFIPTSLVSATGILFGIRHGYLRANPKLGPFPKIIATTLISFILCEQSVVGDCTTAIKSLRKSPLGDYLKEQDRKRSKQKVYLTLKCDLFKKAVLIHLRF